MTTTPLARRVPAGEFAGGVASAWVLKRNCSLTPGALMGLYVAQLVFDALIGDLFWQLGYAPVTVFIVLAALATGAAFLAYARHACDRETLTLRQGRLVVEQRDGTRLCRLDVDARSVRITAPDRDHPLVKVSVQGRSVFIGRHVQPHLRPALARELRQALHEQTCAPYAPSSSARSCEPC